MKLVKRKSRSKGRGIGAPSPNPGPMPISAALSRKMIAERRSQKVMAGSDKLKSAVETGPYISEVFVFSGNEFQRIVDCPNVLVNDAGMLAATIKKQPYELSASIEYFWIDLSRPRLAKASFRKPGFQGTTRAYLPRPDQSRPSVESLLRLIADDTQKKRLESFGAKLKRTQIEKKEPHDSKSLKTARQHQTQIDLSADRVAARIPSYDMGKLLQTWKNALRSMSQTRTTLELSKIANIIDLIEREWSSRSCVPVDSKFNWPTTNAPKAVRSIGGLDSEQEGMLSFLEYHVGQLGGLSSFERKAILDRVFEGRLPKVFVDSYMAEWSEPKSAKRLQKMAECIAAFARNAKRRKDDRMDQAIREWENDLEYLYNKFYVDYFRFAWPTTAAG
jgi:hypothetical protein